MGGGLPETEAPRKGGCGPKDYQRGLRPRHQVRKRQVHRQLVQAVISET